MSYQLKLWEAKEREKINLPEHTAGHLQNKGSEQVQRRAQRAADRPSPAGGRGEGKGAGSAPRTAAPTALQTGLQFLTKDLLRFWMGDIRWEGRGETQGPRQARAGTGAGDAEGRRCCTRGECAWQAPGCLSCLGLGRKERSFLFRTFVEFPRAGTARSAGHTPYRTAGSLSSVEGKAVPVPPRSAMELAT